MQSIQFAVVRDARFRSVDGFHIYADGGTGVMDWLHPVTPRRMLFWDDTLPMSPHLLAGQGVGHHLDSIFREGHVSGTHMLDRHIQPAGAVRFGVGPFVFGRFQHAVVPADEVGNQRFEDCTVHECVINSEPPPVSDLRTESFDVQTGILTFTFEPSEKLVG